MIVYIHINNFTNEVRSFGSIKKLSEETNIKIDNLYACFGRKKLKERETYEYRIIKTKIEN